MSYIYRSLACDAATGTVTPVSLSGPTIGDCRTLTIRGRAPITLPAPGICLRAGVRHGQIICAWRDTIQQDAEGKGPVWMWTEAGGVQRIGWMFASWCAFAPDGLLYVPREANGHYTIHDSTGEQVGDGYAPQSSTGLWFVDANGVVHVLFSEVEPWYGTYDGVQVFHPRIIGDVTAGLVDQEPMMPPRPYLAASGVRRMWDVPTDHAIEFAKDAMDVSYVAISGPDSPEPDNFQGWTRYAPYVTPPVVLPEIVIGPQRPLWRGSLSGIVRGNIGNEPDRTSNRIEDARFATLDMEPTLCALFIDTARFDTRKTIAIALRNPIPVILDDDGRDDVCADILQALIEGGVTRILRAHQFYPSPGQSREAFRVQIGNVLSASHYPVIIRPGYTRDRLLTELQVAEANLDIDAYIDAHPEVVMDLCFGLDRNPRSQWCADYFRQLCAATPVPAVSLRLPPTAVLPPVVVTPKPPMIPGHGHNADPPVTKRPWYKRK